MDLCGAATYQDKALSTTDDRQLSLRLSRLFALGRGDHEVGLKVGRLDRGTHARDSLALDWTGALPGIGAVWARGETAERVAFHDLRDSLEIGVTREVGGRPVSVSLRQETEGGGTVFGLPRADRITGVSVSGPVNQKMSVRVSLTDRQSTVDVYDERTVGVDLLFGGWRF